MERRADTLPVRQERRGAVTRRSVVLGLLGAVLANAWPTYSGYVVRSTWADFGQVTVAALLPYILFVLVVNAALRRAGARLALSGPELLVAFAIAMVAATMQGEGLTGYFLGVITAPHYFASPENAWDQHVLAHVPSWLLVGEGDGALRHFYEGLPAGGAMQWGAFVAPIVWWGTFLAALYLLSCFVAVLLRRQWMEHELLPYPLAEVPMLLVARPRGWLPDVARDRLFWFGAAIPFGIVCWNMVSWFVHGFPKIPLLEGFAVFPRIQFARHFPALHAKFDFFVMSFAYFTSTEILFSLWFFHLLSILQVGIMNRVGWNIGPADHWCSWDAATGWQSLGGFAVLVLWGLWVARHHLAAVARRAFTGRGGPDDADELVSYRTAFFGTLVCFGYCVVWLARAGMTWYVAAVFLAALLLGYIGVAKIAAASGLVYLRGPETAQSVVWHVFGSAGLSHSTMAAIGLTYTFFCDAKGWMMTPFAHALKIARSAGVRGPQRRGLFGWIALGSLLGALAAIALVLYLGAREGAYNFGVATFQWANVLIWDVSANRAKDVPFGTDWSRLGFGGLGALIGAGLIFMRTRFAWWPFNPVGFAISSSYPIRDAAFGVFLVWLTKVMLFRYGGVRFYHRARPFFVGMLVGYVLAVGLGFLVDSLWFFGAGHPFHGF